MKSRMNIAELAPALYQHILTLDGAINKCGLDKRLLHLVKIRASQINGCSYCVDIHIREAQADGMDMQTLYMTSAWRESPIYDARDRAALEWTESVTLVAASNVPDEAYATVKAVFSDEEIAQLTLVVSMINLWNRIGVSSRLLHPRKN